MNPILHNAFKRGDWHEFLCEQLWSVAKKQPSAANLKLALDASHCIQGVDDTLIELVDELISDRRLTSWPLFFRLCSLDIATNRHDRLDSRLERHIGDRLGFRQRRALVKFPRVLWYLNQYHQSLLGQKLFNKAEKARGLLARNYSIDELLKTLGEFDSDARIALVGNGPSIQGTAVGADIDNHDLVVRFNNTGLAAEHDIDIGSETQLWVVSPGLAFGTTKAASTHCAITGPDPWTRASRYWEQFAMQAVTHIATFDVRRWYALVETLAAPPSAGILMIDALRQAGVDTNNYSTYGFSRLENLSANENSANHYRDDASRSDRHNWTAEAELLAAWRKA